MSRSRCCRRTSRRTGTLLVNEPAIGVRLTPTGFDRSLDNQRLPMPRAPVDAAQIGFVRVIEQWVKSIR